MKLYMEFRGGGHSFERLNHFGHFIWYFMCSDLS